jgi:hypothetical protein
MIDLSALVPIVQQVISISGVAGQGIQAAVAMVAQIKAALAMQGYESDTSKLDAVIEDAIKRQAIAAKEKTAEA